MSEFLLPLLILDRICFGSGEDKAFVMQEFQDVMAFDGSRDWESAMSIVERQKAVSVLFVVLDTLTFWSEVEVEKKHGKGSSRVRPPADDLPGRMIGGNWPLDESIMGIEDVTKEVSLPLQARAAAGVGMYARSLRLLEMASRDSVTDELYNIRENPTSDMVLKSSAGICPSSEVDTMKDVLAALGNYDTVSVLSGRPGGDPRGRVLDSIRLKEARNDWEAALQDYERAHQMEAMVDQKSHLRRGTLRCLLELGQLER